MTSARRWAVVACGAIAALALAPIPTARAANGEWEVLRWGIEPGAEVAGEVWTITGTISAPNPQDVITDVDLVLRRVEETAICPDLIVNQHAFDGDGDGDIDPGATTSTIAPQPDELERDRFRFRFEVVPHCNGRYRVSVLGTSDPIGALPGSQSEPLWLGDPSDPLDSVKVELRPPDVAGTSVTVAANRHVTISWDPPPGYGAASAGAASGAPADFLGYGIDRTTDDGATWTSVGSPKPPGERVTVDALDPASPGGVYRYRVTAVRLGADGPQDILLSPQGPTSMGQVSIDTPAVVPPSTTPTSRGGGGSGRSQQPAQGPTTTLDEGYSETIDYSELLEEGEAEAELPDDASSFLDFVPERTGSAVLVPFAIAECLAVWAFHLRYLARRVDDG